MADIRIKDLPLATGPTAPTGTDAVAIDGLTTRKTTITALGDIAVPIASQAEAESGINAVKRMTPLTTKQSIASQIGATLATAAQGNLADSAVQPGDLSTVATTGIYSDLTGKPTLGNSSSLNVGTTAGTVAAGDDSRIANALQPSYENTVTCSDFGAVPDCTAQGVGTDVIPAITAAINYAISTYGDGCRVVLPAGRYRASTATVIDLQGKKQITLEFQGTITTDSVAMTMITITNCFDLDIKYKLLEGGVFNGWANPSPYGVDYSTTRNVVAAGGQEAVCIRGVFGYRVEAKAFSYAGRALRITKPLDIAHPETGAISGWIETGRSLDLSKPRVAQSLWADYGDVIGHGNWGALDRLAIDFDYYPPVWEDLNDIELSAIDSAFGTAGPIFRGCVVVKGDDWYVGDVDDSSSPKRHLTFEQSASRGCFSINVTKMRFLNAGVGLYLNGVTGIYTTVEHSVGVGLPFTDVLSVNNVADGDIKVIAKGSGTRMANIQGVNTTNLTLHIIDYGAVCSDDIIRLSAEVGGSVIIDGLNIKSVTSGKSAVYVGGTPRLDIYRPRIAASGAHAFDIQSLSANVNIYDGVLLSGTAFKTQVARQWSNGLGVSEYVWGDRRVNSGGNSGGAGGAVTLGIADPGSLKALPMAQVKAKLSNSTGTELQGGVSLQYRPTGAAGQVMLDGLEVSHTVTDGETVGVLLTRIGGVMVAKRVKVGATGSGGVGFRALIVDN